MVINTKEMRLQLPIRYLYTESYRRSPGAPGITIGKIPAKTKAFFRPVRKHFTESAWDHFCGLVMAITIAHCSTIERLAKLLRNSTHRTNHGDFLWRSKWNESSVIRMAAMDTLKRLRRKNGGKCYLIIDETHVFKRGKKMEAVGKIFHHATKTHGRGHTIIKVSLWYRGVPARRDLLRIP